MKKKWIVVVVIMKHFVSLILYRVNSQSSFNNNKSILRAVDKSSFKETRID